MSRGLLPWMLLGCVALVGFALAARGIGESAAPHARDSVPARKIVASSSEPAARHYVTPDQLAAASRDVAPTIVDFQAVAHDRGLRSLAELADGRPAILVFVKQGCPCSVQFQPVFNRLAEAFDGR
ncbi:MAG TPA: hypothetical protein VMF30_03625, partial [Pirellulales bacterium]|nr:hypothetical protein [Pirellulales bacterium]